MKQIFFDQLDCGWGELIIPDNVTSIGSYAFRDCKGLSRIYICEDTELGEGCNDNITAEIIYY